MASQGAGTKHDRDQTNTSSPSRSKRTTTDDRRTGALQSSQSPVHKTSDPPQIPLQPSDSGADPARPLSSAWATALAATSVGTMTRKRVNVRKQANQNIRPPRALFCLTLRNSFRKLCIRIVEWRPFEFLILMTIFANCAALAAFTPYPKSDTNEINQALGCVLFIFIFYVVKEDGINDNLGSHEPAARISWQGEPF